MKITSFWSALLISACMLHIVPGHTQDFSRLDVPITEQGVTLKLPNAGGLIAPQFSQTDLDNDGILDLVVFDRVGDIILPFINGSSPGDIEYRYAPEYQNVFPDSITTWMLLRDYDGDGVEDIFTFPTRSNAPGVIVYQGSRTNGSLSYEQILFPDQTFDFLTIPNGTGTTQIYVANTDIPEVVDVDGDGDLDILSFEVSGGTLFYYRNTSVEDGNGRSALTFVLEDSCYGRMEENGFSSDVELSSDGLACGAGILPDDDLLEPRHAGSTVVAFDDDGNGLLDVLIGDISNNNLVMLYDSGDESSSWFSTKDSSFPSYDEPVDIDIFNGAFYLDIDNDGLKDLLAAPNVANALQATDHVWLYLNQGTASAPVFQLHTKSFLLDEMVMLGIQANVALADVDQDGLMDMVIGTNGAITEQGIRQARLHYYRNSGTVDNPSFDLADDDFLRFSAFEMTSNSYSPGFGDIDTDGDLDMLIGDNVGFIYFLENIAGPDQPFVFDDPIYKYQDIRVGQESRPHLIDVSGDGLLDLVIGERNFNSENGMIGSLNYLENVGSATDPIFDDINTGNNSGIFGQINTRDLRFLNNFSAPYLVDTGDDFSLLMGTEAGDIFWYDDIKNNIDGSFNLRSARFGGINEGMRSTVALYDIDNDMFFEALVGNRRGGISWYNTGLRIDGTSSSLDVIDDADDSILLSPNPSSGIVNIRLQDSIDSLKSVWLYDSTGRRIANFSSLSDSLDLSHLESGPYVFKIICSNGKSYTKLWTKY